MEKTASKFLPPNRTELEVALADAFAIEYGLRPPVEIAKLWSSADCPVELLPWLAWALSVDIWDDQWSENQKRLAIANSAVVHRQKGTIGSMRRSLEVLENIEIKVREYIQGAYTFNLLIKGYPIPPTEAEVLQAEELALNAKNVRSHLHSITIEIEGRPVKAIFFSAPMASERTDIWPVIDDELEAASNVRWLSSTYDSEDTTIQPLVA